MTDNNNEATVASLILGKQGNTVEFDARHGGPWDRGSADSYYHRKPEPHYYVGNTGSTERITNLSQNERAEYMAGYHWNEAQDYKKQW